MWHGIAQAVPDRDALISGDRRVSWGEFDDRAARLASHFWAQGLRPGDKVAIACTNRPEYLEAFFAALKMGCAPVNVNYRYVVDEVRYVLDNSDAKAIVHDPDFGTTVQSAIAELPEDRRPVRLETGTPYEDVIAVASPEGEWQAREPDGDDLVFLYTGGTTGMPKGVMWRNDDLYHANWAMARPGTTPPDPIAAAVAGKRTGTCLPACPLMHGTGMNIALSTLAGAATVVLVDRIGLDPELLWNEIERNDVAVLTIVGDPFARPLLGALDNEPKRWDLSCLRVITSSGATWSPEAKSGLLRHLPTVRLIDALGASEGLMTRNESTASSAIAAASFAVNERVKVLDEQTGVEVGPGSGDVGLLGVTGPIPLGYYKDQVKTDATFRVVNGVRYSIPGDYATVEHDGTIRLLGRGSACINTGGEKVYPEEVEGVLREHPDVFDCVIVGVADERFGEMVVALVQLAPGTPLDDVAIAEWSRDRIAGYKRPKRWFVVESLERNAAGKANYPKLRALAADLVTP